MKTVLTRMFALLTVLTLLAVPALAQDQAMLVRITAECYDTNHVGSDYIGYFCIGDLYLEDSNLITLSNNNTYLITTEIVDNDSTPDSGRAETEYRVTKNDLKNGFVIEQFLTVVESGGRYSRYSCDWYIRYEFIPVYTDSVYVLY